MRCIACKSEIFSEATVCHKCSRFQSAWKNWAIFGGASAGIITLVVSGAIYIASAVADLVKTLLWEDSVRVVAFDYIGRAVFVNAGDGPIFLSHVDIDSGRQFKNSVSIYKHIRPQEFADVEFRDLVSYFEKWKGEDRASIVSDVSDDLWNEILEFDLRRHECFRHSFMHPNDPKFQLFADFLGHGLRTFDVKAQLYFYSTKTSTLASMEFPLKGVVYRKDTKACSGKS